jgi:hypothetical protein
MTKNATKKLVPIDLEIERNKTKDDLFNIMNVLEGAIRRCCKHCDEPMQLIMMARENEWLKKFK